MTPTWYNLVRWTLFAMVNAEQFGVTQANVEAMRQSPNPEIRRMLGTESSYGQTLGVTNDWVVRIVKAVGNYGESFDRNLGAKSPLNLPRGLEPPVERRRPAVQPAVPVRSAPMIHRDDPRQRQSRRYRTPFERRTVKR